MNRMILYGVVFAVFNVILGCASHKETPVTPSELSSVSMGSNRVLWGLWHVNIDPETLDVKIMPLRGAAFTANVTQFMQAPASPVNMISIALAPGSIPTKGYFLVDVTLRHPFPSHPIYRGFDVRGIFMANASVPTNMDPSLVYAGPDESRLINADGWTRWWNPGEFTSYKTIFGFTPGKLAPPLYPTGTLNGYKYFADDLDKTEDFYNLEIAKRGTFSTSPGVNTRQYEIQFKMDGSKVIFDFNYAVDASWDEPDKSYAPSYPIEAYSLKANCQEAYMINADFSGSTAWYVDSSQNGGNLRVALEIFDWQALGENETVPQQINAIRIESADLGIAPVDVFSIASVTDGNGINSSVFTFDLENVHPSGKNNQKILVSVHSSEPSTYEPQVIGGSKFSYPDAPLAAYKFLEVPISEYPPTNDPVVLSIVPKEGIIDSGDLPVQVTGLNFAANAQMELVKNNDPSIVIIASGETVSGGGTKIDCILDMDAADGAQIGTYHVKVINAGPPIMTGQLDNGFMIISPSQCNEVHKEMIYEGTMSPANFTFDVAFTKEGLLLIKGYEGGASNIYGYDVTQNGNIAPVKKIIPNVSLSGHVISIDVDDLTENIIMVAWLTDNKIWAYKSDGTLIDSWNNYGTSCINSIDTNDDGSIWVVGHIDDSSSPPKIAGYRINRYAWNPSTGKYEYDASNSIDASEQLLISNYNHLMDCAISYGDDRLFIFSCINSKGKLFCYDLSSGKPVFDPTRSVSNFFPALLGLNAASHWLNAADIEIDHSDPNHESCRMILYARLYWEYGMAFVKMDTDGNVLDVYQDVNANSLDRMFYGFAINRNPADPDKLYVVGTDDSSFGGSANGDYNVYKMPPNW